MKPPARIVKCPNCGQKFSADSDVLYFMALGILLGFLLALVLCPPANARERKTFTVPFRTVNSLILLDVQVNGKPQTFILDTGAQLSLLDRSLAGLEKQKAGNNVNGVIDTSKLVRVGLLCIGPRCFAGRSFGVVDYGKVSSVLGVHVDGQLGQDILRKFDSVLIDYKASTLTLSY